VILLSKYNLLLNEHVKTAIIKSQLAKTQHKDNVYPGGLVIYLSKTTADNIIETMSILMKKSNSESIREAIFFLYKLVQHKI